MSFIRVRLDQQSSREPTHQEREEFFEQLEAMLIFMLKKYGPQKLPRIEELLLGAHGEVISVRPTEDEGATIECLSGAVVEKIMPFGKAN